MGQAVWPLRKRAATSASEAADTTVGIMVVTTSMGPLKGAASGGETGSGRHLRVIEIEILIDMKDRWKELSVCCWDEIIEAERLDRLPHTGGSVRPPHEVQQSGWPAEKQVC